MVISMSSEASPAEISQVVEFIRAHHARPHISRGAERTIIGVIGYRHEVQIEQLLTLPGVETVIPISRPYKLVSREFKRENTIIKVDGVQIGGAEPVMIAGPCSVENEEQILQAARMAKKKGAHLFRGGAFKPRTSPYSFQGLGEEGLRLLQLAKQETGLPIVTEILDSKDVPLGQEYADVLQIGARNMQNYSLLKEAGRSGKPVLLKRGMSADFKEFMMSAEYIMSEGNNEVILCERGIRSFVEFTRNTLDLNIIPAVKSASHLPIIVDPSHGTGRRDLIESMSLAALAAGADGLMVEMHPRPESSWSDANQTMNPQEFSDLMEKFNYFIYCKNNFEKYKNSQKIMKKAV
ncbi:MAG: 3-deoxy-7-phosphoheptulonate synthase [Calditrichia bacterium]